MSTRRRIAVLASVPLLIAGLSGCSGDDEPEKDADKPDASASGSADPGKISPSDLPDPPKLRQAKGAVSDVSFGDCPTDAGKQSVTGTITGGGKVTRDYVVVVSWVNDTSDVLARGVAVVKDVAPGAEQEFDLSASVPEGISTCTFRVERGALGQ